MDDFQNADNTLISNTTETPPIQTTPNNPAAENKPSKPPVVSKPVIIMGVVVLIAIIGLLGYRYFLSKSEISSEIPTELTPTEAIVGDQSGMPKDPTESSDANSDDTLGNFSNYSLEKLQSTSGNKAVLFFAASWCPTCKALELDIKNNIQSIPSSLAILRVDYDTSTTLKTKYGVTYQHTLIQVDSNGNEIKRWFGSPTLAELQSQLN
jgi:thiol-disulfide isomerase/thioredoxin